MKLKVILSTKHRNRGISQTHLVFMIKSLVFLCLLMQNSFSEITFRLVHPSVVDFDSGFIGAGVFARDSSQEINVRLVSGNRNRNGALYFLSPDKNDSADFLFHNYHQRFTEEDTIKYLGNFKQGTDIRFMYIPGDTTVSPFKNKKLYTGQNRVGLDKYISEASHVNYGNRMSIAGKVNDSTIQIGFEAGDGTYTEIIFEVTNCFLEGVEKSKIPPVHIEPQVPTFNDSVSVTITVPPEGLYTVITRGIIRDTIRSQDPFKIYYKIIDSNLSSSWLTFNNPVSLIATTEIQSYAVFEGDSNWLSSEIFEETFIKEGTGIIQNITAIHKARTSLNNRSALFDLTGKRVGSDKNIGIGVYLNRSSVGKVKKVYLER